MPFGVALGTGASVGTSSFLANGAPALNTGVGAIAIGGNALSGLATIITPNLPEAEVLLGRRIQHTADVESAAKELASLGCPNILIKGGHFEEDADSVDVLYLAATGEMIHLPAQRIATRNNHGTGCTLSSAIAANLAKGIGLEQAVRNAKEYISAAIAAGSDYKIGKGHGPVHHFFAYFG